ncbi:hypothetical protein HY994_03200 [Candidatus Micrarchaeota archaeon]|nr:hypothetical protein [Candidatus Micrarchaeota archaeon]
MHVDRLDVAALAVLLLLVIGAYVFFFNGAVPSNNSTPSIPARYAQGPCASANTTHGNAACFAQLAFSAKNASICLDSAGPDECAGSIAHRLGDNATCISWSDPQACAYFAAISPLQDGTATKDFAETACPSLRPDYRQDQCFFEYALRLDDASLCGRILRQDLQSGCQNLSGGNG